MRITLLNPPFLSKGAYYYGYHFLKPHPNPALAILASVCRHNKTTYQLLDAKLEGLTEQATIERIVAFAPNVVGITIPTTAEVYEDFLFIRKLKNVLPRVTVLSGGPHVSALPVRTLAESAEIDIVAIGSGENTLNTLIQSDFTTHDDVDGIAYRGPGGEIRLNPPRFGRAVIALPKVDWTEFPRAGHYMVFHAMGCPFSCNYCFSVTGHRTYFAEESDVLEQIQQIVEYARPEFVNFADPTFCVDRKRTVSLLRALIGRGLNGRMQWRCHTRTDMVDEEVLSLMKEAGCRFISYGVESGSTRILERMGKKAAIEDHRAAVRATKKVGIDCQTFFIFGHITELREDVKESIKLIVELNPKMLDVGIMVPWPGTEVYEAAANEKYGLSLVPRSYPEGWKYYDKHVGSILRHAGFGPLELEALRLVAYIKLYVYNLRFVDLLRFGWGIRGFLLRKLVWILTRGTEPTEIGGV